MFHCLNEKPASIHYSSVCFKFHCFFHPNRRVPENTGWVLDGFPTTYAQAKLLERALSGFDTMSRESTKQSLSDKVKMEKGKSKKSLLAPDPKPAPPAAEPTSGINLVVHFDIKDELSLKRSAGRTRKFHFLIIIYW